MYNIRLIEYANGTAQLRVYDTCVGIDSSDSRKDKNELDCIEPFTNTKVKEVNDFFEKDPERSMRNSLARTKSKISSYARSNLWEWFVTFTFSGEVVDRTDFHLCMKKTRIWLNNARRKAPKLKYLCVPELHSDKESWHIHLLLSDIGDLEFKKSGRRKKYKDIYNVPQWKYGFSTATKIDSSISVSKYVLKYITKDAHILQKGSHRYYVSNNLHLPKESSFFIAPEEQEDFLITLIASLGLEVVWQKKKKNEYTSVEYIELE